MSFEHDDQYSGMRPLVEVSSNNSSFKCSLTLKQIQKELKKLTDMAHKGIDIDESRFDYLLKAQEHNEEYKLWLAEEKATWRESVYDFAEQCLERTRTFVPVNVFESSVDDLIELGLTPELAKRVLQRQCLWLTRMSKAEISTLHESDLLGRYNSSAQHMDIIETAAIYISLPDKFNGDELGRKGEWRDQIEESLRRMLQDNDNGQLPEGRLRNPAYDGLRDGPVEDVTSVRATNIVSGRHSHRPRRSFMEVCKQHSILSAVKPEEDPAADSSDSDAGEKFQDEYEDEEEEDEEDVYAVDETASNLDSSSSPSSPMPQFQKATGYQSRDFPLDDSFYEQDEQEESSEDSIDRENIPVDVKEEETAAAIEDKIDEAQVEAHSEEEGTSGDVNEEDGADDTEKEEDGANELVELAHLDVAAAEVGIADEESIDKNIDEAEAVEAIAQQLVAETSQADAARAVDDGDQAVVPDEETPTPVGNARNVEDAIYDQLALLEAEENEGKVEEEEENDIAVRAKDTADYCIVSHTDGYPDSVALSSEAWAVDSRSVQEPLEDAAELQDGPEEEAVVVEADFGYEGDDLSSSSDEDGDERDYDSDEGSEDQ